MYGKDKTERIVIKCTPRTKKRFYQLEGMLGFERRGEEFLNFLLDIAEEYVKMSARISLTLPRKEEFRR